MSGGVFFLTKYFFCILLASIFYLQGCAGSSVINSNTNLTTFNVALQVNFIKQKSESLCGLATIQMVADYYGKTLNASYTTLLEKEAKILNGITAASLKACMNVSGFDTAVFQGKFDSSLQGIYRHLDLKRPIIILVSEKVETLGHYVIIVGYEVKSKSLLIINPGRGYTTIAEDNIISIWKNSSFLTIVALPK